MRHRLIAAAVMRPLSMMTVASMSPCRDVPQPEKVPSFHFTTGRAAESAAGAFDDAVAAVGAAAGIDGGGGAAAAGGALTGGTESTTGAGVGADTAAGFGDTSATGGSDCGANVAVGAGAVAVTGVVASTAVAVDGGSTGAAAAGAPALRFPAAGVP